MSLAIDFGSIGQLNLMNPEIKYHPADPNVLKKKIGLRVLGWSILILSTMGKGITVEGREHISKKGPAIIVTNHMGLIEAVPPYVYSPQIPIAFSKKGNFQKPVLKNLLRGIGAIPANRDGVDTLAVRYAVRVLVNQKGIIFTCPEGTRGRDSLGNRTALKKAETGVIFIAQMAANKLQQTIPISPWAVWGTEGIWPEIEVEEIPFADRIKNFHPARAHVRIGEPYLVYPSTLRPTAERMQSQINTVMLRIRDMLPEKYHGFYAEFKASPSKI